MPIKPAPSVAFKTNLSASPNVVFTAIIPANPPEISIARMVILTGLMPAYCAAVSEWPNALSAEPNRVRQIKTQTKTAAARASSKLILAGADFENCMPSGISRSCKVGKCVGSGNEAVAGSIAPTGRKMLTRR